LRRLALPAALAVVLARGYLGPALHEWPFIRGVDHYSHAVMANRMMTAGRIEPYLIYPPGFHTMTAMVSRLSGLDPLEIFPVLGPALLLLPALALYALARRLWGFEYGVAAALLSALLGGTYYYFNDAMYPNLVASQFLVVLALAALTGMYDLAHRARRVLLALLGSSVVLYHQVASLYLAVLLALVGVYFVLPLLFRDRQTGLLFVGSFALLGLLAVAYAWDTYDLGGAYSGCGPVGREHHGRRREHGRRHAATVRDRPPDRHDDLPARRVARPARGALLVGDGWRRGSCRPRWLTPRCWPGPCCCSSEVARRTAASLNASVATWACPWRCSRPSPSSPSFGLWRRVGRRRRSSWPPPRCC
jgi:hypothetical protein